MNSEQSNDLLLAPVFHWTSSRGESLRGSLPDVLAALSCKDGTGVEGFDYLQAHQQHPWHAFLVQLAAMSMYRKKASGLPQETGEWRARLLELSEGSAEAWRLVVEDVSKPAFLQAPIPDGFAALKNSTASADGLDLLQAAKNHDCKHSRAGRASCEQWVFALIAHQTFQGYSGRGNYGVVRMNGGLGNRPGIGAINDFDLANHFQRDVLRLLDKRGASLVAGWNDTGTALLWILPWNGKSQLNLTDCDPFCIEICRRIRLKQTGQTLTAFYGASDKARLLVAEELSGNVGDPWTPVDSSTGKALTLSGDGFTYKKVAELLFSGDWAEPSCAVMGPDDRIWLGRTLVRGQGKTEGYHERRIPVQKRVASLLRTVEGKQRLAEQAKFMVEDADKGRKMLRSAICALVQPGRTGRDGKLNFEDQHPEEWLRRFEQHIDAAFYPHLWEHAEAERAATQRAWQERLRVKLNELLEDAIRRFAVTATWRYRAINKAEAILRGSMRREFKALFGEEVPA